MGFVVVLIEFVRLSTTRKERNIIWLKCSINVTNTDENKTLINLYTDFTHKILIFGITVVYYLSWSIKKKYNNF